jgi:HEAT repeat protein
MQLRRARAPPVTEFFTVADEEDVTSESLTSVDSLLDDRSLTFEAASALAHNLAAVEPLLDAHLARRMMSKHGGDARTIKADTALRVLRLIAEISDGSRVTSCLVQLLSHPNLEVRAKAVLLLGRANLNLTRVRGFLTSSDSRVRASAVEALWGSVDSSVRAVLWNATGDPSGRVAVNALLGLCKAGDREAFTQLVTLASSPDPVLRSGAAWAMGEAGAPEFAQALDLLAQDAHAKVRAMAGKSRKKLRS